MNSITTIFFDVGGVCLTNGWDHTARYKSAKKFSLDHEDMEKRHNPLFVLFEKGLLSLDEYLDKVVFYKKRNYSKEDFVGFMFSQSRPINSTLKLLDRLSSTGKYHLATINNESRELNDYRIDEFGLTKYFKCFFSSCYLGVRKPEEEIFDRVLQISQRDPEECLYIDDSEENYNAARNSGMNSILLDKPGNLVTKLKEYKIEI